MTITEDEDPLTGLIYVIRKTEDRGRAVFACRRIPKGVTIHTASKPYICTIKEIFKKEVCAWCFKYQHGKNCSVKHPNASTGLWFCSEDCLCQWIQEDFDGKLVETLACLRSNKARKQSSTVEDFPIEQAKLVASAIVQRSREGNRIEEGSCWDDVLELQSEVMNDELDPAPEVKQIIPFLKQNLPPELRYMVESTAYPFLLRHLCNSFGIWELPVTPDSEHLGSAMYPSASYFNHSCDPNVAKVRQGRTINFVTSREVQAGEELCISYGHTERELDERRQVLQFWWGFACNCTRCIKEIELKKE